ncbi:glycosyltransferase [Neobacillus niacini]|uniref:glycosyltransferase n=1 Tax=Neobacillus niacini TaxID=86668 RepID=UPI0039832FF4
MSGGVMILILFTYWVTTFLIHWRGLKRVPELPVVGGEIRNNPLLSIIIAAKDEEGSIAHTLKTLINQKYVNVEIIVVNDRSIDNTAKNIEKFMGEIKNKGYIQEIKLIHIHKLPTGWLGKNYALLQGYLRASGNYILFTDADIQFSADTIGSAMAYLQKYNIDHLTLLPYLKSRQFWLRGFIHLFIFSLYLSKWPWMPNNDRQTKQGIGVGAFNLLTREAYEKIGTHKEIALRPDDDLQLGMLVKKKGLKQRVLIGKEFIEVEWYQSFSAMLKGLEKNIFAGLNYSLFVLFGVILGMIVFYLLPFLGIWVFDGWYVFINDVSIILILILYLIYINKLSKDKGFDVLLFPIFVLILIYVFLRSCLITLIKGGISWKGTFYSINELKSNRFKRK